MNLATLVIGLIATALWSGVQALNAQARSSYDRAAAAFGDAGAPILVAATTLVRSAESYVPLRRAGWPVSPVLEGTVRIRGASFRLIGIEPLTSPKGSAVARPCDEHRSRGLFQSAGPHARRAGDAASNSASRRVRSRRTRRDRHCLRWQCSPMRSRPDCCGGYRLAQAVLGRPGQVSRLTVRGADGETRALLPISRDSLRQDREGRGDWRSRAAHRQLPSQPDGVRIAGVHRRTVHRACVDRAGVRAAAVDRADAARLWRVARDAHRRAVGEAGAVRRGRRRGRRRRAAI